MELKYTTAVGQPIYGAQSQIIRDDINGSMIAVQNGTKQVFVKVADLWSFLEAKDSTLKQTAPLSLGGVVLGNGSNAPKATTEEASKEQAA